MIILLDAEVLSFFAGCAKCVAVRGNVDDTAPVEELPEHVSQTIAGWDIFVTHIAHPDQGQKVGSSSRVHHLQKVYLAPE